MIGYLKRVFFAFLVEIRANLLADTTQRAGTNALTGAKTTNNRRKCRYPDRGHEAIPQQDWQQFSPGHTPVLYQEDPFFEARNRSREVITLGEGSRTTAACTVGGDTVPPPHTTAPVIGSTLLMPGDDFLDVFGHGGSLD